MWNDRIIRLGVKQLKLNVATKDVNRPILVLLKSKIRSGFNQKNITIFAFYKMKVIL